MPIIFGSILIIVFILVVTVGIMVALGILFIVGLLLCMGIGGVTGRVLGGDAGGGGSVWLGAILGGGIFIIGISAYVISEVDKQQADANYHKEQRQKEREARSLASRNPPPIDHPINNQLWSGHHSGGRTALRKTAVPTCASYSLEHTLVARQA